MITEIIIVLIILQFWLHPKNTINNHTVYKSFEVFSNNKSLSHMSIRFIGIDSKWKTESFSFKLYF